jgi:hypothetical protein
MEIFVGYRFTGEDPAELSRTLGPLCEALRSAGHNVFCSFEHEHVYRAQGRSIAEIYRIFLERSDESDVLFAFTKSLAQSKGLTMEVERFRRLGKPIVLAIPGGVARSLRSVADVILEYDSFDDLCRLASNFSFPLLQLP